MAHVTATPLAQLSNLRHQSYSVIMHISLLLSFNFLLPARLITGICAGPRDGNHAMLWQPGTGELAWHHLVLNETS